MESGGRALAGTRTSKIHCLADHRGRPVAFALTPGNVADISMAVPLLDVVPAPARLIADKDAERLRNWLKARKTKAVVPSTASRTVPYALDRKIYKHRFDRAAVLPAEELATDRNPRYDRLARNFLSGLALVAVAAEWVQ